MNRFKRMLLASGVVAMLAGFGATAQAADMIGNCELTGQKGSIPIANPAKAGQLTVEVSSAGADLVERRYARSHQGRHGILHGGGNRLARRL